MRIRKSGRHEKFEAFAIIDRFFSNCYRITRASFHNLLQENRLQ